MAKTHGFNGKAYPHIKVFNGKRYQYTTGERSKAEAIAYSKMLKQMGRSVRMVNAGAFGPRNTAYVIYSRLKGK